MKGGKECKEGMVKSISLYFLENHFIENQLLVLPLLEGLVAQTYI